MTCRNATSPETYLLSMRPCGVAEGPTCNTRGTDAWGCQWSRCLQGDAEDAAGIHGIHLQRHIVAVAQKALTAAMRLLGPLVLPLPELVTLLPLIDAFAAQVTSPFELEKACQGSGCAQRYDLSTVNGVTGKVQSMPLCGAAPSGRGTGAPNPARTLQRFLLHRDCLRN